jgi:hypothetical protein
MWARDEQLELQDANTVAFCCAWLPLAVPALAVIALACQLVSWPRNPEAPRGAARNSPVQNSAQIPVGTVLPLRLENTIDIKQAHPDEVVEARIMQDVPLPDRGKIPMKLVVKGSILSVVKDSDGAGVKLSLKFDQIDDRKQTLVAATSLRAIASYQAVRAAQMSFTGPDSGTPAGWANTVQIGGDIRFGDGGPVRNRAKQKVGKGVLGGVLVHVHANPGRGCDGPVNGDDHPQALWVFSADACGVYKLDAIQITHTGKSAPTGEITLHFEKDNMKLDSGTALLLRVVSSR